MSGKRSYRLGKRQASVDATKRRILTAATAAYSEYGIEGTSMQEVARRADVAAGTVLYHFPTPESLAVEVVDSWLESMDPPRPDVIDPGQPLVGRVTTLVVELYALYERTDQLYRIYQKNPDHPVLARAAAWWDENVAAMVALALDDRMADEEAVKVVSAIINPGFRGILVMSGIHPDRAADVAGAMAVSWLEGGGSPAASNRFDREESSDAECHRDY
jgi:AcrR family transcriptional regulator